MDWGQTVALVAAILMLAGAVYTARVKLPADQLRGLQDTVKTLIDENKRLREAQKSDQDRIAELEKKQFDMKVDFTKREAILQEDVAKANKELSKVYEKIGRAVVWSGKFLPEGDVGAM